MAKSHSLFTLGVHELAQALQGQELELPDGRVITITQTEGYPRSQNDRGVYKPMLEMSPGQVFIPRVMSAFVFLIVALDGKQAGACVRIVGIDTPEAGEIGGGGRVSKYVGFTEHRQVGRIEERMGKSLRLVMEGTLAPEVPATNGGSKVRLTDRVLSRYADALGGYYTNRPRAGESYDAFLTRIKSEWSNEAQLKKQLGIG